MVRIRLTLKADSDPDLLYLYRHSPKTFAIIVKDCLNAYIENKPYHVDTVFSKEEFVSHREEYKTEHLRLCFSEKAELEIIRLLSEVKKGYSGVFIKMILRYYLKDQLFEAFMEQDDRNSYNPVVSKEIPVSVEHKPVVEEQMREVKEEPEMSQNVQPEVSELNPPTMPQPEPVPEPEITTEPEADMLRESESTFEVQGDTVKMDDTTEELSDDTLDDMLSGLYRAGSV